MALILIVLTLAIAIYSLIKAYVHVYSLSRPAIKKRTLNPNIPVSIHKFYFISQTKIKLSAIEYLPTIKPRGTIIAFHYLGGSKESIFRYVDYLIEEGFRVISFDFPNHGESEVQKIVKFTLDKDAVSFMQKIKEMGINGPYGVIGLSMGATPALMILEQYPEIKAAVIDSGPLIYVNEYFDYVLKIKGIKNPLCCFFFKVLYLYCAGFKRMSKETRNCLSKLCTKPIMFIHGEKDTTIPINNSLKALELLRSDKAFYWCEPNARHLTALSQNEQEYRKRVIEFFNRYMCI